MINKYSWSDEIKYCLQIIYECDVKSIPIVNDLYGYGLNCLMLKKPCMTRQRDSS